MVVNYKLQILGYGREQITRSEELRKKRPMMGIYSKFTYNNIQ